MTEQLITEAIKPMARGQITIPVNIRKKLGITPKTWLWIKLLPQEKIVIEPIDKKPVALTLAGFLKQAVTDQKTYWQIQDTQNLKKVSARSLRKLKRLVQ